MTKSSEAELREEIARVLQEHEDHSPIYTCRYQIVDQLLDLIHQREKEVRKEILDRVYGKIANHELYSIPQVVDYLDEVFKSLEDPANDKK